MLKTFAALLFLVAGSMVTMTADTTATSNHYCKDSFSDCTNGGCSGDNFTASDCNLTCYRDGGPARVKCKKPAVDEAEPIQN